MLNIGIRTVRIEFNKIDTFSRREICLKPYIRPMDRNMV